MYAGPVRDIYRIRTPENVSFEFELAGIGARALAWTIDVAVMFTLTVVAVLLASLFGAVLGGLAMAFYFMAAFTIQWGYGALTEWRWAGQTPGKRILGLRVLTDAGTRISFMQAVVRNLIRTVDILPFSYLVGGVSALLDPNGRRLGDIAAGTVVIRQRRSPRPSAVMAPVDRYNSFINDPAVVHASGRITPPERDAMLGLAVRRENLPLPVRYSLFAKLSSHLERRLGIQRPDYFSEEKFVLNLAAVVLGLSSEAASLPPPPPGSQT